MNCELQDASSLFSEGLNCTYFALMEIAHWADADVDCIHEDDEKRFANCSSFSICPTGPEDGEKHQRIRKRKGDKMHDVSIVHCKRSEKSVLAHESSRKKNHSSAEAHKADYIYVKARRGEATDSHSLAERVRREKISEKMKCLQGLVPGCHKMMGKAGMLDEVINYVQSLQRQVEFLSTKLAVVNPTTKDGVSDFITNTGFHVSSSSIYAAEMEYLGQVKLEPVYGVDESIHRIMDSSAEYFVCPSSFNIYALENEIPNVYNFDFQEQLELC